MTSLRSSLGATSSISTRRPLRRRARTRIGHGILRGSFLLIASACWLGCGGNTADPNAPNTALERRDTELKHEPCNLPSGKGLDANGDGRPDIVQVFSGSREVCRAVDINLDTVIDRFVYFDDAGQKRRVESGFDRDTRPDEIAHFEGGQLVRKERETNNDQQIDTWSYYEAGRLVREERDSTGDGFVDQWWRFDRPDRPACAIVVTDVDGDGEADEASKIDTCAEADQPSYAAPSPKPAEEPEAADEDAAAEGEDAAEEEAAEPPTDVGADDVTEPPGPTGTKDGGEKGS